MKKGFTLIEILIVISIIGILAVALLPSILSAPATARDAGRKSLLNDIVIGLEQYKAANGSYPAATSGCLGTAVDSYLKGNITPVGAKNTSAADETVVGCSAVKGADAPVAYCPIALSSKGYSYAVAIRMETPMKGVADTVKGNNVMKLAATCPNATTDVTNVSNFNAGAGVDSNWYYILN